MINFTNIENFGIRNKRLTDFKCFGYNSDTQRSVYILTGVFGGKGQYIVYDEYDNGHKAIYIDNKNEDVTFYQVFGDNYTNVVMLDDVSINIDAKIIQAVEE